uniref:Uncharacterized protein n=1 Tax=Macrostomum lignano TaxID=282301 RepID=A0A1I8FQ49_9PLAT
MKVRRRDWKSGPDARIMESCNDTLQREVADLHESLSTWPIDSNRLSRLSNRDKLESDIRVKENSLLIDVKRCMAMRKAPRGGSAAVDAAEKSDAVMETLARDMTPVKSSPTWIDWIVSKSRGSHAHSSCQSVSADLVLLIMSWPPPPVPSLAGVNGGQSECPLRHLSATASTCGSSKQHHGCPPGDYRPPTFFGTVAACGFFAMSMGFTLSICSFIVFQH